MTYKKKNAWAKSDSSFIPREVWEGCARQGLAVPAPSVSYTPKARNTISCVADKLIIRDQTWVIALFPACLSACSFFGWPADLKVVLVGTAFFESLTNRNLKYFKLNTACNTHTVHYTIRPKCAFLQKTTNLHLKILKCLSIYSMCTIHFMCVQQKKLFYSELAENKPKF